MNRTSEGGWRFQVRLIGRPGCGKASSPSESHSPLLAPGLEMKEVVEENEAREAPLSIPKGPYPLTQRPLSFPPLSRRELRGQEPAGPSVQAGAHGIY